MDARLDHITRWLSVYYDHSKTHEENWKMGEDSWDALTPHQQWFLWNLHHLGEVHGQDRKDERMDQNTDLGRAALCVRDVITDQG